MDNLTALMNSPGLWCVSSLMVIVVLLQAFLFWRSAWQEGVKIGFPKEKMLKSVRAAAITAIGPSLSPVIILIALIAVLGVPTAWMRMNDIGASRTELAVSTIVAEFVGAVPGGEGWNETAFSYALWGMAVNNFMWMFVTLLFAGKMSRILTKVNSKYDPKLTKLVMDGAALGLFGTLLSGQVVSQPSGNVWAAAIAAVTMFVIIKFLAPKIPSVREPALGIAMLVGMFVATALVYSTL